MLVFVKMQVTAADLLVAQHAVRRGELSHDQPAAAVTADEPPEYGIGHACHRRQHRRRRQGHGSEQKARRHGRLGTSARISYRVFPEFRHITIVCDFSGPAVLSVFGPKTRPSPWRGPFSNGLTSLFLGGCFRLPRFRFGVLAAEALDAARGIHQLLLAGEERVAIRADFHVDVLPVRRPGHKTVAARAVHFDFVVVGMDSCLHGTYDSLSGKVYFTGESRISANHRGRGAVIRGAARSRRSSPSGRSFSRKPRRPRPLAPPEATPAASADTPALPETAFSISRWFRGSEGRARRRQTGSDRRGGDRRAPAPART